MGEKTRRRWKVVVNHKTSDLNNLTLVNGRRLIWLVVNQNFDNLIDKQSLESLFEHNFVFTK